ncbi:MAG: prepilin-type N-terminal cleavage/methylation domain-containing protein [Planctomycetota bacterium]
MQRAHRTSQSGRRGLTLVELLLVVTIIGIVAGIGLGMFASFDPARRAARGLVANALRQTRNTAIANGAPARVVVDPATGAVRPEAFVVAGTWRFETEALEGARGVDGIPNGFPGAYLSDGFVGQALDLDLGPRGAHVAIDLSVDPIFQLTRGVRLGFAVRPESLGDADVVDVGGVVRAKVRRDGSVEFSAVTLRIDDLGRPVKGETIRVRTPPAVLEPARWTRVELRYDLRRLVALVEGVPVAERAETRELWTITSALKVGGGRQRFEGRVDDLVLSVVTRGEAVVLPKSAVFETVDPIEVRFDASGGLDPVVHARPVEIPILFDDGERATVRVRTLGTVES